MDFHDDFNQEGSRAEEEEEETETDFIRMFGGVRYGNCWSGHPGHSGQLCRFVYSKVFT